MPQNPRDNSITLAESIIEIPKGTPVKEGEEVAGDKGSVVESKEGIFISARNWAYNHPLSQKAREAHTKWRDNSTERRKGPNPTALDMHHAIQAHSEALAHHLSHVYMEQDPFDAHANQAQEHLNSIKKILAFHENRI